jgi:hypothetical protein
MMKAIPVEINWHPMLPVFASESFLKAVGDEYGWVGGIDESGGLRCILPYTLIGEMGIRMARFRVETIPLGEDFDVEEERLFLTKAVEYLRSAGADIIIPATTNTIFRTYPAGADAAPYGSYTIDLCQAEEALWGGVDRITRQNINTARKRGVSICSGIENLEASYELIRDTFGRSRLPFMSYESLKRFMLGLGENGKIMTANYQGNMHSCVLFAFSKYCAYAVYGGNMAEQHQGANKLLHWEAIRFFRNVGVKRYDFVGARIDPEKGSKQDALSSFKKHLGGRLRQGYMWKYPIRPVRSLAYTLGVRILRGGDIVDYERHKMESYLLSQ